VRLQPPARSLDELQDQLDRWRTHYNHARPHKAMHGQTPAEPGEQAHESPLDQRSPDQCAPARTTSTKPATSVGATTSSELIAASPASVSSSLPATSPRRPPRPTRPPTQAHHRHHPPIPRHRNPARPTTLVSAGVLPDRYGKLPVAQRTSITSALSRPSGPGADLPARSRWWSWPFVGPRQAGD
jgi:hypothetical protein